MGFRGNFEIERQKRGGTRSSRVVRGERDEGLWEREKTKVGGNGESGERLAPYGNKVGLEVHGTQSSYDSVGSMRTQKVRIIVPIIKHNDKMIIRRGVDGPELP